MTGTNKTKGYIRWERLTRRWWFFAVIILMQFLIPPYASKGIRPEEIGNLTGYIL